MRPPPLNKAVPLKLDRKFTDFSEFYRCINDAEDGPADDLSCSDGENRMARIELDLAMRLA